MKNLVSVLTSLFVGVTLAATNFAPLIGWHRFFENRRRIYSAVFLFAGGFLCLLAAIMLGTVDLVVQFEDQGLFFWNPIFDHGGGAWNSWDCLFHHRTFALSECQRLLCARRYWQNPGSPTAGNGAHRSSRAPEPGARSRNRPKRARDYNQTGLRPLKRKGSDKMRFQLPSSSIWSL